MHCCSNYHTSLIALHHSFCFYSALLNCLTAMWFWRHPPPRLPTPPLPPLPFPHRQPVMERASRPAPSPLLWGKPYRNSYPSLRSVFAFCNIILFSLSIPPPLSIHQSTYLALYLQTKSKYKMRRYQNHWQPPLQPKLLVQFGLFWYCSKAHGNNIWVTIRI